LRALFHVHTCYSFDSMLSPARVVRFALKKGINILAVTDHDTINGSLAARELSAGEDLEVIIGAEYSTEKGDIIGLFLCEEIIPGKSSDVIAGIKKQGGLVVLPHPARLKTIDEALMGAVDLVECHNSRVDKAGNEFALSLAVRYGKPCLAGADAHLGSELANAEVVFEEQRSDLRELLLHGQRTMRVRETKGFYNKIRKLITIIKS